MSLLLGLTRALNVYMFVELVLLGTGKRAVPPPPHLRQYLSKIGIQIDVMDTVRTVSKDYDTTTDDYICTCTIVRVSEMRVRRTIYSQKKAVV